MSKNNIVVVNLTTTKYAPEDGYIIEFGMCVLNHQDGYQGEMFVSTMWDRLRANHWGKLQDAGDESVDRLSNVAVAAVRDSLPPRKVERRMIDILHKARVNNFYLVATDGCRVYRYLEDEMPELAEMVDEVLDLTTLDALCEIYNPSVWENVPETKFNGEEVTPDLRVFIQNDLEKFIVLRDNFLFVADDVDDDEDEEEDDS